MNTRWKTDHASKFAKKRHPAPENEEPLPHPFSNPLLPFALQLQAPGAALGLAGGSAGSIVTPTEITWLPPPLKMPRVGGTSP